MSPPRAAALATDFGQPPYAPGNDSEQAYHTDVVAAIVRTRRGRPDLPSENKEPLATSKLEEPESLVWGMLPHALPETPLVQDETLQEWEGRVLNISVDVFEAALTDVTTRSETEEEVAELPLRDIRPEDLSLLREGAVFRWIISYIVHKGTKARASRIVFRRRPHWTEEQIKRADERADQVADALRRIA